MTHDHALLSFSESLVLGAATAKLSERGLDWTAVCAALAGAGTFCHGLAAVIRTAGDQYRAWKQKQGPG